MLNKLSKRSHCERVSYLANEFLLLCRVWHVADMLKKLTQSLLCVLLVSATLLLTASLRGQASNASSSVQLQVILK